jgi:hypothetical protein
VTPLAALKCDNSPHWWRVRRQRPAAPLPCVAPPSRRDAGAAGHGHTSEAFTISQGECDAITESVEEVVLAVALFISDPEAFDLVQQVIS